MGQSALPKGVTFVLKMQMNAMKPIPAKANPVKTFLEVTGVPVAKVTKRRIEKQDVKMSTNVKKIMVDVLMCA